jgi:hypothetical protein
VFSLGQRQLRLLIGWVFAAGFATYQMGGLKLSSKETEKTSRKPWISAGKDRQAHMFETWTSSGKTGKENFKISKYDTEIFRLESDSIVIVLR